MDNSIQLSITTLRNILETAEELHSKHGTTIPVVRISKTAQRQHPDHEDKYETSILMKTTDAAKLEDVSG